jgi:antitoxin ParD1/3/4
MTKSTSFNLGKHYGEFITSQVQTGRYGSASEVMREGLRLVEERVSAMQALNAELNYGLSSGIAEDFSWEKIRGRGQASS